MEQKFFRRTECQYTGALKPGETALASARFQGRHVVELAAKFIDGRKKT